MRRHTGAAWTLGWFGAVGLALANATIRETTYRRLTGEFRAQQLSSVTLIGLLAGYVWALERRWPLPSTRAAADVGLAWAAVTVGFEGAFGHWVDPHHYSWAELAANYNLATGTLWPLVPAFVAVGPALIRKLQAGRSARQS